jgi:hypothetical protein
MITSENDIKRCIAALDANPIVDFLKNHKNREYAVDKLIIDLLRCNNLIIPYQSKIRENKISKFFNAARDALLAFSSNKINTIDEIIDQLSIAEEGYRRILLSLENAEISKLSPAMRISATLRLATRRYVELSNNLGAAIVRNQYVTPQSISH